MRIYTGRGDSGETDLMDQSRVSKADPRIEAYGTVDELNALVGKVRPTGEGDIDDHLHAAQNHLHVLSADLANPDVEDGEGPRIDETHVETVEDWIDSFDEELEPLEQFILPGGGVSGSDLHHARTVCRRAERRLVALGAAEGVNEDALAYVNRLSDALFVFARAINQRTGHVEEHPTY
ncbi:MAG: cob(I)yrinic acid a,c-diamide adenosyltransferase [Halobacteriaceae archaeon]